MTKKNLIEIQGVELEHFEDTDGVPDLTENMCEYCLILYVKQVPPKRPLSPFIFFS